MPKDSKPTAAQLRAETAAIKAWLQTIAPRAYRGRRTREFMTERVIEVRKALVDNHLDPLERVQLIQERLDLERDLVHVVSDEQRAKLQAEAVKVLASYSQRKGISRAAWREAGVDAAVLDEAGVK